MQPDPKPDAGRPFFIVGCDRSGTTMLRLILDRSADVAIPTESMFVVDMARLRPRFGQLRNDQEFDRLAATVWRHPKVREWHLQGTPPPRDGLTGATAYRAALEAPYAAYARAHGKPRWGDKTPYYVNHIAELRRVFPDARIVNVVRDGRDVALSLLRVPFGPSNVWAAAHQWRQAIEAGDRAAEELADDLLTVRYEDVVADPEAVVPMICGFLEIAYQPGMLAVEETPPERIAAGQEAWFRELYGGISAKAVGKWRRQMARRSGCAVRVDRGRPARAPRLRDRPRRAASLDACDRLPGTQLGREAVELRPPARVAGARARGALPGAAAAGAVTEGPGVWLQPDPTPRAVGPR